MSTWLKADSTLINNTKKTKKHNKKFVRKQVLHSRSIDSLFITPIQSHSNSKLKQTDLLRFFQKKQKKKKARKERKMCKTKNSPLLEIEGDLFATSSESPVTVLKLPNKSRIDKVLENVNKPFNIEKEKLLFGIDNSDDELTSRDNEDSDDELTSRDNEKPFDLNSHDYSHTTEKSFLKTGINFTHHSEIRSSSLFAKLTTNEFSQCKSQNELSIFRTSESSGLIFSNDGSIDLSPSIMKFGLITTAQFPHKECCEANLSQSPVSEFSPPVVSAYSRNESSVLKTKYKNIDSSKVLSSPIAFKTEKENTDNCIIGCDEEIINYTEADDIDTLKSQPIISINRIYDTKRIVRNSVEENSKRELFQIKDSHKYLNNFHKKHIENESNEVKTQLSQPIFNMERICNLDSGQSLFCAKNGNNLYNVNTEEPIHDVHDSDTMDSQPIINVKKALSTKYKLDNKNFKSYKNLEEMLHEESMNTNLDPPLIDSVYDSIYKTQLTNASINKLENSMSHIDRVAKLKPAEKRNINCIAIKTNNDGQSLVDDSPSKGEMKKELSLASCKKRVKCITLENLPQTILTKQMDLCSHTFTCYSPTQKNSSPKKVSILRNDCSNLVNGHMPETGLFVGSKDGFWDL